MKRELVVALVGNPNCGKTTLFNRLTGMRQHTGNYSGVTVESQDGSFMLGDYHIKLIDLPGVYSLSSSLPEEEVVFAELINSHVDVIINVLDASMLKRNLYLTTQIAELHIPVLLALNMSDEAQKRGFTFDIPRLESYFGADIVEVVATKKDTLDALRMALGRTISKMDTHGMPKLFYGEDIDESIEVIAKKVADLGLVRYQHIPSRFFAIKLLEHDHAAHQIPEFAALDAAVEEQIRHLYDAHAIAADTFIADCRYALLAEACSESVFLAAQPHMGITEKIDAVVTHKFLGLPIFFLVMYLMFFLTFQCADPFINFLESFFLSVKQWVSYIWTPTVLPGVRELVIEGILAGVSGVLLFLPNILFLFLGIAFLEATGYMSRAAFLMDGIMRRFGLHGKSFVPLVLGFGCTVPAILATRTIESETDRKTTILILPLMSCGARLPIYALLIPAFFPLAYQHLILWGLYGIGIVVALLMARLLKSTVYRGEDEVYLMELPPYRFPTPKSLFLYVSSRGLEYLKKAGTVILAISIVLFICNKYPEKKELSKDYDLLIAQAAAQGSSSKDDMSIIIGTRSVPLLPCAAPANICKQLEMEKQAEMQAFSLTGRMGKILEPIFAPLGFDWKISTALISALAAKEVFVAQLGILYSVGESTSDSLPLRSHLRANYTSLQGLSIMIFALLSIPCIATLAVIKKELGSWRYVLYEGIGLFALAWGVSFVVYQIGLMF